MSLLRFAARSLFASHFIAEGVRAFTKPDELAPEAERFTNNVTPLVQRVVPAQYASYVPERAETWVRVAGAAQVAGGVMFATGIGRRLGAVLLAKASVLNLAMALPERGSAREAKSLARPDVLRNAALLGASVLAARDTQGRPSLKWRAKQAAKSSERRAASLSEDVHRKAKRLSRKAKKQQRRLSKSLESAVN